MRSAAAFAAGNAAELAGGASADGVADDEDGAGADAGSAPEEGDPPSLAPSARGASSVGGPGSGPKKAAAFGGATGERWPAASEGSD
eukprot:7663619-Alexandrium_andersonii.AAC.1